MRDSEIIAKVLFPKKENYLENSPEGVISKIGRVKYIIDYTNNLNIQGLRKQEFFYLSNPNGGIRWFFSKESIKPLFLKLYSSNSIKAKCFSSFITLYHFLGFNKSWIYKSFTVLYKSPMNKRFGKEYAVFTGTKGPNRKSVIVYETVSGEIRFVKKGLSFKSNFLLKNEGQILNHFAKGELGSPKVIRNEIGELELENIRGDKAEVLDVFGRPHYNAFLKIYQGASYKTINNTSFWQNIESNLFALEQNKISRGSSLIPYLKELKNQVNEHALIPMSFAHGDFTPWNSFVEKGEVKALDWELGLKEAPILFDVFHFIIYSGILLKRKSANEIFKEIELVSNGILSDKIYHAKLWENLLNFYLLYNISYYLLIYNFQKKPHRQVYWQLSTWLDLLKITVNKNVKLYPMNNFLKELFFSLKNERYAVVHELHEFSPEHEITGDIDILISKGSLNNIKESLEVNCNVLKFKKVVKSFMTTYIFFFDGGKTLSIDFITNLKRKNIVFDSILRMINASVQNSYGVKQTRLVDDFSYLVNFYQLNNAHLPVRYAEKFSNLLAVERNGIKNYLNLKYSLDYEYIDSYFESTEKTRRALVSHCNRSLINKGFKGLVNKFIYVLDSIKEYQKTSGFMVTISGVDGAGKSTIINNLKTKLSKEYRKEVIILRHRPSILPILSAIKFGKKGAEKRAANRLPRKGGNKSLISSWFRFSYYYLDYLFGQLYIYFKHIVRGRIVVFDRYYFDFIVDGKRTNIAIKSKFIKPFYNFLIKPRFNFFIYESAEEILKRKKELSSSEITELNASYMVLFKEYSRRYDQVYLPLRNKNMEKTTGIVLSEIVKKTF